MVGGQCHRVVESVRDRTKLNVDGTTTPGICCEPVEERPPRQSPLPRTGRVQVRAIRKRKGTLSRRAVRTVDDNRSAVDRRPPLRLRAADYRWARKVSLEQACEQRPRPMRAILDSTVAPSFAPARVRRRLNRVGAKARNTRGWVPRQARAIGGARTQARNARRNTPAVFQGRTSGPTGGARAGGEGGGRLAGEVAWWDLGPDLVPGHPSFARTRTYQRPEPTREHGHAAPEQSHHVPSVATYLPISMLSRPQPEGPKKKRRGRRETTESRVRQQPDTPGIGWSTAGALLSP